MGESYMNTALATANQIRSAREYAIANECRKAGALQHAILAQEHGAWFSREAREIVARG